MAAKKRGPKGPWRGPQEEEDFTTFEKLCMIQCTAAEIAQFFSCSVDTVERRVMDYYGKKFAEVFAEKKGKGKVSLRRAQWRKAVEAGNTTMLIWLGKQFLGQSDMNGVLDDKNHIVFQSRIGPGGQLIQEIKTAEDWEQAKTVDVKEMLVEDAKPKKKVLKKKAPAKKGKKK